VLALLRGVAQRADDVAECKEATIDVDALLGPVSRRMCPLEPLGALHAMSVSGGDIQGEM
jgi:hypothetical protein